VEFKREPADDPLRGIGDDPLIEEGVEPRLSSLSARGDKLGEIGGNFVRLFQLLFQRLFAPVPARIERAGKAEEKRGDIAVVVGEPEGAESIPICGAEESFEVRDQNGIVGQIFSPLKGNEGKPRD
jgi:hypothetical protein